MADNNQIKSYKDAPAPQESEESVDQNLSDPAASVDPQISEPENTDTANQAENTDTQAPADTAETPEDDVAQSANIAQDDDTPPQDEVSEQIPEPEVKAENAENSEAMSSDEDEIASPAARNDGDESTDPSAEFTPDSDPGPQVIDSEVAQTRGDDKLESKKQEEDAAAEDTDTPTPAETPEDGSPDLAEPPVLADTTDNPNAKWYVVHTFSGHENKVATNLKQRIESEHLENRIVDILVPTQDKIEIRGGKKEQVKEKIFPGYILVKMDLDDASWLAVRTTQGVTAFVGMNNKPTPISEREVSSIVKFMTQGAPATFKDVFMVNDTVKIVDGPFTDFIGKVESVDKEKGKVRVLVSIFGRETPVELDFLQVTKL